MTRLLETGSRAPVFMSLSPVLGAGCKWLGSFFCRNPTPLQGIRRLNNASYWCDPCSFESMKCPFSRGNIDTQGTCQVIGRSRAHGAAQRWLQFFGAHIGACCREFSHSQTSCCSRSRRPFACTISQTQSWSVSGADLNRLISRGTCQRPIRESSVRD